MTVRYVVRRRCVAVLATSALSLSAAALLTAPIAPAATAKPAVVVGQPARARAAAPVLSLRAAAPRQVVPRYGSRVYLDLGVYAVAGDNPFEVRATRASYHDPIEGRVVLPGGDIDLPGALLDRWGPLRHFLHLRLTDSSGTTVLDQVRSFCPNNYDALRVRPDAPDVSTYPQSCAANPFTLGAVYGVDQGYGVPVVDPYGRAAQLPLGRYTATVWISQPYRDLLGLDAAASSATVHLRVVKGDCGGIIPIPSAGRGCKRPSSFVDPGVPAHPASHEPPTARVVPPAETRPDLRSLPAFGIRLTRHGFLQFAATVWNAGPSPLVVDGFRRHHQDVMDAYQYFYDSAGNPVGHASAGQMEWDARDGHTHWHFRDFARYRLLDSDKHLVVRSRKEAFCLANTDAVDYTVPGANWRPDNTDLRTACGNYSALSVREVLDAGSGDTYYQSLPGQSFNVSSMPNGVYYIAVEANPQGRLYEALTDNNNSYRRIVLRGTPDHRRVYVPPVGLVDVG